MGMLPRLLRYVVKCKRITFWIWQYFLRNQRYIIRTFGTLDSYQFECITCGAEQRTVSSLFPWPLERILRAPHGIVIPVELLLLELEQRKEELSLLSVRDVATLRLTAECPFAMWAMRELECRWSGCLLK